MAKSSKGNRADHIIPKAARLNVGSGVHPLHGWCNIDSDPLALADVYLTIPPIPYPDESISDIYAGHFLEHLTCEEAGAFLDECRRCLKPGGNLGIVVPDTREIMKRWLDPGSVARMEFPAGTWHDMHDLDEVCRLFIFSTVQTSQHRWAYDSITLARLMERHGFEVTGPINHWMDPRVAVGAWYQFGLDARRL